MGLLAEYVYTHGFGPSGISLDSHFTENLYWERNDRFLEADWCLYSDNSADHLVGAFILKKPLLFWSRAMERVR